MYKLPKKLYLDDIIEQEVNLVCVGPYDAQIIFENGIVIQSFYKIEGEISGDKKLWFDEEWIDTSEILKVTKQKVVLVERESDFIFKIVLSNGLALYFHTEISQYESINIRRLDDTLDII